jgi:hypothetical protein
MWLAEFCSASEYSIFDEATLRLVQGFTPPPLEPLEGWPPFGPPAEEVVLGVDPARGGPKGDDCAVAVLVGRRLDRILTLPPGDEMALSASIVTLTREVSAETVIVEAAGLGHGVYARVRELLERTRAFVKPFVGAKKAQQDPNAANQKAEVCLWLRRALLDKDVGLPGGPEFDRLAAELLRLRLATTMDGKVRIVDPPQSPDYADAAICAFSSLVYTSIGIASVDVDWL